MLVSASRDYIAQVIRHWYALCPGAIAGVAGLLKEMEYAIPLPAWAWWTIAFLSFSAAQFWAYCTLWVDREKRKTPDPDLRLIDLISRVATEGDINTSEGVDERLTCVGTLVADIRQRAVLGKIDLWGRLATDGDLSGTPLTKIPAEYWETHQIDALRCFGSGVTKTEATRLAYIARLVYRDMYMNRTQTEEIWPSPRRSRFALRWPIQRLRQTNP